MLRGVLFHCARGTYLRTKLYSRVVEELPCRNNGHQILPKKPRNELFPLFPSSPFPYFPPSFPLLFPFLLVFILPFLPFTSLSLISSSSVFLPAPSPPAPSWPCRAREGAGGTRADRHQALETGASREGQAPPAAAEATRGLLREISAADYTNVLDVNQKSGR